MIFVYPTKEICVQKPDLVKAQTDYFSLVLANNKGLLVSSLAVVAILIAVLTFVVWLKQAGSKLS